MTENSQDVWKNKYPYLSSVKDFDKNNPKLRWNKKFSKSQLQKIFPTIGGINKIEILNVTSTGRVKNVRIHGDYGIDQIVGADKVGSEYIFVKGEGGDSWENILLISDQNNTTINVNGNPLTINGNAVVLQEGQFIIIEGNNFSDSQTMFVNTNNSSDKLFRFEVRFSVLKISLYASLKIIISLLEKFFLLKPIKFNPCKTLLFP